MAGKFEIYKDKSGGYRFRLKAANGEVIPWHLDSPTQQGATVFAR